MKNQEFITLGKYASLEEAQVIKAMLDSMGIDNQILNATAAQVMPYLELDIRIVVNGADFKRARDLMNAKIDQREVASEMRKVEA